MRVDNRLWDVIVVGGGPAGASAARHAARLGLETLVLERARFPRDKVCAGGLTTAALRELGLPFPPELIEGQASRLRPRFGREHLDVESDRPFVYLISRASFDQHLLWAARQAGAEVREGVQVTGVSSERDRAVAITGDRAYAGRVIIGADGVHSKVARSFRGQLGPWDTGLCLAADLPIAPEQRSCLLEDGIEVRYGLPPRGYGWVFPKRGRVSVGVGAIRGGFRKPGPSFLRFIEGSSLPPPKTGWNLGLFRGRLRAHLVPLGGRRRPVARGRVLLAGDAAGFADPFTGEGLRYAFLSGRLAAETADRIVRTDRPSTQAGRYREACWDAIESDLAWARWLTRLFSALPGAASRLFFRRPQLFGGLLEVLRGELTYRRLILGFPRRFTGF